MNVLSHGIPFGNDFSPLMLYDGPHDVRSLGAHREDHYRFDYEYDLCGETFGDILNRIGDAWRPDLLVVWYPANIPPPRGLEHSPIPTLAVASDWNLFYAPLALNL